MTKRSTEVMTDGYTGILKMFQLPCAQCLISVMVLRVMSNERDPIPPLFFPRGLSDNAAEYKEVSESVLRPRIESMCKGQPYTYHRDSVPSHKATTKEWLSYTHHDHVPSNTWLPRSPDQNPLDYYVFVIVERKVNNALITLKSLKSTITSTISTEINKGRLIRVCQRFRPRIEAVIDDFRRYIY